ncbi:TonB-dependent receptor [Janthinobacterium agaricidamnosum]|uniref:TonB-dependent Receptor Plug domain protein n=1 Tax=Janthinobacterium agaricidamnosum NBRC 102515 = DSM 9628 TaxID=1349767 RepID=W0V804_9BURK|nr:TonB-dependent receptor [Janthinobacterium agaricidamnosum]CDG84934.1 tonB-dependent Receptor Plug domain protein [Janthinobacterium agaricidamnosum NBRC 102515 = DSM 9628]
MMMETVLSRSLRLMFSSGAVVASLGLLAHPAMAEDAPVQRVEITGSAIKRIDAETSVPVTVIKMDDLKKNGVTTIEQVMANLSAAQSTQGTSQSVGSGTGGASFADLRGIGANKTLVLLNGRRLANNALDSSAPDLNLIPFAALERVEVLRDGASSLYGSDAVGGVINFITRKDFQGGVVTIGGDTPQRAGGSSNNANIAYGIGDMAKDGFNVFAVVDHQEQHRIGGTQRPFNTRYAGGLSQSPSPANYSQGGSSGNPLGGNCASAPNLISDGGSGCQETTSSFVDYVPKSERTTGLIKGTLKLNENHELGIEYLASQSKVQSLVAPVPYGALIQNIRRPDGTLNPYYPGNGNFTPNIPLDPNFTVANMPDGAQPGFVKTKWRDLPNGSRTDESINKQQRLVVSLTGVLAGWDYNTALTYNENKVQENIYGYSDGDIIGKGVRDGVINPYGPQDAAGTALLNSAAVSGSLQTAKGKTTGIDFNASREVGDWLGAGRPAALAVGAQTSHESFTDVAEPVLAQKVIASNGLDPNTNNTGSRNVSALFTELNVPITKMLDVTAAVRYDKYSDFGSTTNPKLSFRLQPNKQVLLRGSYSTGFRAPSLYELHSAPVYTNISAQQNDPVNCPGGVPIPGKSRADNCGQQFQALRGGNANLQPEKSQNATLGIVVEPINNLTLSADLWAIELKHSINYLSENDIFANPAQYAGTYHRTATGDLATDGSQCPDPATCGYVDQRDLNLGGVKTNGVDLGANYRWRSAAWGDYSVVMNATYVHKYEYQNSEGGDWVQGVGAYTGKNGPVFRWQNNITLNWNKGDFGAGLAAHYKSGYVDAQTDFNTTNNVVASYTTFDGYGSWKAFKNFTLTAGVRNLFDRDPPLSYQTDTFQAGFDPRFTDPTGRTFYMRGSYNF